MKKFEIAFGVMAICLFTSAQGAEAACKSKYYTGKDTDPIWWAGRDNARANWSGKVTGVIGHRWAHWSKARHANDNCDWLPTQGVNYCVARAQPCK